MASSIVVSFLGALQASVSVLLVIVYGVIASQFELLDGPSGKKISAACVRLFLPALLITKVGAELHTDTGSRYVPIIIWAVLYVLVSIGIGLLAVRIFRFPSWVTAAIAFNNTTSLPLLLIDSLESTGILDRLVVDGDTTKEAITRAQSYFLVCAVVGNCFTFALGPRLVDCENAPDKKDSEEADEDEENQTQNGAGDDASVDDGELTSLMPRRMKTNVDDLKERALGISQEHWEGLSPRTRKTLRLISDFFNAPLLGALLGAIIGLTPPLHRAFFNDTQDGGFFNAWLTSSLEKIGSLFVTLQVVVVGISLSSALRKMKRGDESGSLPILPLVFVFFIRFVFWPVVSIAIIWALATKTSVLSNDPILWFSLMLAPCGPPAMKLVAMADVSGVEEGERMTISKLLAVSYAFSPLMAFAVVGSLYASSSGLKG